jgi:hypothetical protein
VLVPLVMRVQLIYDSIHSVIPDEMRITAKSAKTQKSTEGFEVSVIPVIRCTWATMFCSAAVSTGKLCQM